MKYKNLSLKVNHKRLLILGNKLRVAGGAGWGAGVTGRRTLRRPCENEPWMFSVTEESLASTSEMSNTLCVNQIEFK